MKRLICLFVFATIAFPVLAKEDWRGRVVDEKGEPVAYANVAVLSKTDSTMLCGVVTEEDGTFNIVTDETDGIMMVAMLGYKTVYLAPVDGAVITLTDDTQMLEGAVASAVMPKTKLTGEGLQTNVRGSVLENAIKMAGQTDYHHGKLRVWGVSDGRYPAALSRDTRL